MFNNTITLSNGVVVPQLALGTWLFLWNVNEWTCYNKRIGKSTRFPD